MRRHEKACEGVRTSDLGLGDPHRPGGRERRVPGRRVVAARAVARERDARIALTHAGSAAAAAAAAEHGLRIRVLGGRAEAEARGESGLGAHEQL